jgi:hypothetical protein
MTELIPGVFTNADIAEWFEIEVTTFNKRKAHYVSLLKGYCNCETIRGGVKILTVDKPYYVKNSKYQIIKEDVKKMWDPSGLDSCTRIAD